VLAADERRGAGSDPLTLIALAQSQSRVSELDEVRRRFADDRMLVLALAAWSDVHAGPEDLGRVRPAHDLVP
jgi:hypothetical protein